MPLKSPKIFLVAGEASGDLHAGNLVKALSSLSPGGLNVTALGGANLKAAGATVVYDLVSISVVGLSEVLQNIRLFREAFRTALKEIDSNPPDLVILVDYPDFNLRLAAELKRRNIPVVYYISPQVWAWRRNRVWQIKKIIGRMIVIFEFEKEFYKNYGIDVDCVGHPLLDIVHPSGTPEELRRRYGISPEKRIISLLPGSRESEVSRHLPLMVRACALIQERIKDVHFLILKAPALNRNFFDGVLGTAGVPHTIIEGENYNGISASDLVLVCSGTATIETAILEKPMVVVYKVSPLTALLLKPLIKLPYIAMVNVVAGKRIVPELVQSGATPLALARQALELLENPQEIFKTKIELHKVKGKLGTPGASARAAKIIMEMLFHLKQN
jgi:lipid-A-disaccharide synthase